MDPRQSCLREKVKCLILLETSIFIALFYAVNGSSCLPLIAARSRCATPEERVRVHEIPGNMAALMTVSQLSSGIPAYESYYRQLDPGNTGKISAGDAAQFLKKSGLPDSTLGKIWDLADSDKKGYLDKRGFFIALRLVASAQSGNEINLNNLNQHLAAPNFRDTSSPLLSLSKAGSEPHWAIRLDEKGKFEGIFDSLSPVNGLLSGDKVRPVLINSKLPLDVLGKIWDLSDIDKNGHLDKDEFTVAMHLVYRAMEKEPVPTSLPNSLIPPSKRKKTAGALPGAVAVLPSVPGLMAGQGSLKDTLRSTPPLNNAPLLSTSAVSMSPKHSFRSSSAPAVNWVVSVADRERYDELFKKTDIDNNGLINGTEVIEIFMLSSLSQTMLAQIWGLADTKQTGKLNQEQFALAMYLIEQKTNKGIDPPTTLTPDMIPPSERTAASAVLPDGSSSTGSAELTGNKELDDLSQEIAQLQREKFILEQEIMVKEDAIRHQNSEVQDMQTGLDRESSSLMDLESQKRIAQERLEEMDQQHSKLDGMLGDVKQKYQEESHTISSLHSQIRSQESNVRSQEDELSRSKVELSQLQGEEAQLEQKLLSGRVQLDSIMKSLKTTQEEINQAHNKLSLIQETQKEVTTIIDEYNSALKSINGGNLSTIADLSDDLSAKENGTFTSAGDSFKSKLAMFNNKSVKEHPADPFHAEDPFKSFSDPFGDPFKESDPFKGTSPEDFFKKTDKSDPFGYSEPFGRKPTPPAKPSAFSSGDPLTPNNPKPQDSGTSLVITGYVFGTVDPFGGSSFGSKGGGFADFSQMLKKTNKSVPPPKKNVPNRPAPPYGVAHILNTSEPIQSTSAAYSKDPFLTARSNNAPKDCRVGFAHFGPFGSENQQLEWAKRASEREEQERLRRLQLQEQQDLDLAIALSKADLSGS
ncbi:epidermal growth factor receptor substrate 15-like 1 isoform X4 [Takifugu rubripes]|uniref:epidermal growth factor receptor substrate 15-like 1 isoform X4 n=1 Tax=Takifugu rubripes TaxID=31033 RepID=UPI001145CBFE|nr:epidermal growth factor receptor substrate 15-like 1 isoform X4 [Takifugu rubripes]